MSTHSLPLPSPQLRTIAQSIATALLAGSMLAGCGASTGAQPHVIAPTAPHGASTAATSDPTASTPSYPGASGSVAQDEAALLKISSLALIPPVAPEALYEPQPTPEGAQQVFVHLLKTIEYTYRSHNPQALSELLPADSAYLGSVIRNTELMTQEGLWVGQWEYAVSDMQAQEIPQQPGTWVVQGDVTVGEHVVAFEFPERDFENAHFTAEPERDPQCRAQLTHDSAGWHIAGVACAIAPRFDHLISVDKRG